MFGGNNMKKTVSLLIILAVAISSFAAVTAFAADEDYVGSYVVFGDSIAAGYGLYEFDSDEEAMNYVADRDSIAYAGIVSRNFGYSLDNFAKSGAETSDLLEVLKRSDVLGAVKNADLITVSIGGNDMIHMYDEIIPIALTYALTQTGDRTNADIEQMYKDLEDNLTVIMQTLVEANNGKGTIMLQTLYNPFMSFKVSSLNMGVMIDYYIQRINEIYQKVYNKVDGFVLVDVGSALNADEASFYQASEKLDFHPTAHGHALIADTVSDLYNRILSGNWPEETTEQTSETKETESTTVETEPTRIDMTTDEDYTTDATTVADTDATTASTEGGIIATEGTTATTSTNFTRSTTSSTTPSKVTIFDSLGCTSSMVGSIAVTTIVSALGCAVICKKGKK